MNERDCVHAVKQGDPPRAKSLDIFHETCPATHIHRKKITASTANFEGSQPKNE